MGTMNHQLTGKIEFHYPKENLYGWYELGNVKKKTKDYFSGEIHFGGKKLLDVYGNYMGYMDVGGVRYFDVRNIQDIYQPIEALGEQHGSLPSDSTRRIDSTTLRSGNVEAAQKAKEMLEELQRNDRKLREACHQRREKGGKKFAKI